MRWARNDPKLDPATIEVVKRVLAMSPKRNEELKVGRAPKAKKRGTKGRAVAAKPRDA